MKINVITIALISIATLTSCNSSSNQKEENRETPMLAIATTSEIPAEKYFYVNATSGLSLRSGTNLKSKKMLTLPYGAQVQFLSAPAHTEMTVAGITGEMIEVNYQGATGFTFNGYLTALAPPQLEESLEHYAKRISTPDKEIKVLKTASNKGENYGMTTSVELPAQNWNEMYRITQRLFNLPKSINPDFTQQKTSTVFNNKNKRERTQIDALTLKVSTSGNIENITYNYALRDYKRNVTITETRNGFTVTEEESSL